MDDGHDKASKLKGLAWLLGSILFATVLALGLGPFARLVPWTWEKSLGKAVDAAPAEACRSSPKADAALTKLVTRLYPVMPDDGDFSIDVTVEEDPQVNAFATLGGRIYVNRGFLAQAQSAEEMAGVLAHEIEHVHRRHIIQGFVTGLVTAQGLSMVFGDSSGADWARFFLSMGFTRTQEAEADEGGLKRLQAAHIDNKGFRDFFERMESGDSGVSFLSDHPSSRSRAEMTKEYPVADPRPVLSADEWNALKNYCGATPAK